MFHPLFKSTFLLPFITALVTGCVVPGDPGRIEEPETASPDPPETTVELQPAAADFLFLIDRSASWSARMDRWQGLARAVASFAGEHEGTQQIAATAFPRDASCSAAAYVGLDRGWSSSSTPVTDFLDRITFDGGSTLGPALEGANRDARARAAAHRSRSTSIVLLTDATPNDDETCVESSWERVAAIAGQGFLHGKGPVAHLHVISVVGTAVSPDHFARIDAIADAGNGYPAIVNGSSDDVARSAGRALADIRARMTTCTLVVPAGVHPEELTIASPDGSSSTVTRVNDASECDGATFYLDDPETPHLATLCSGPSGRGGICEMTYVRAQVSGAPKITVSARSE
jgi:hypothetical protein